jgi:hypothetical protein
LYRHPSSMTEWCFLFEEKGLLLKEKACDGNIPG